MSGIKVKVGLNDIWSQFVVSAPPDGSENVTGLDLSDFPALADRSRRDGSSNPTPQLNPLAGRAPYGNTQTIQNIRTSMQLFISLLQTVKWPFLISLVFLSSCNYYINVKILLHLIFIVMMLFMGCFNIPTDAWKHLISVTESPWKCLILNWTVL